MELSRLEEPHLNFLSLLLHTLFLLFYLTLPESCPFTIRFQSPIPLCQSARKPIRQSPGLSRSMTGPQVGPSPVFFSLRRTTTPLQQHQISPVNERQRRHPN